MCDIIIQSCDGKTLRLYLGDIVLVFFLVSINDQVRCNGQTIHQAVLCVKLKLSCQNFAAVVLREWEM